MKSEESAAPQQHIAGSRGGPLPVSPSLAPSLAAADLPQPAFLVDRHVVYLALWGILLGTLAAFIAQALKHLIGLFTNLSFYGVFSFDFVSPDAHTLGPWVIPIPVIGGLIVGMMARYGSRAIRGHGIPEAMEQVLTNQSRIPLRITWLKPLSSAIAIGTGGPFGAEGPIIATGGALGSMLGQGLRISATERKTLLAAGAAAGMAATFGSPVAAVLLAIELLLFEFRPRSIIPVALAAVTAAGWRIVMEGSGAVFAMHPLAPPSSVALACYILLGALLGLLSVGITRVVYWVEECFERLPIHWMWWPALGGVAVGIGGWLVPQTLGVGYHLIEQLINGDLLIAAIAIIGAAKFIVWAVALGSGTSGGTLAPLFIIGGACGALAGAGLRALLPGAGIDPGLAALVGMAATFAGASRAFLASVVFAFETTLQPLGLLPLLGGCAAAYLVSILTMRQSIMTEKIARRGVRVPSEYVADPLDRILVGRVASSPVITLTADIPLADARTWLLSREPDFQHQGFPLVTSEGHLLGVLTRRDLLDPARDPALPLRELLRRPPVAVHEDSTLRQAADHMANHEIGRLPVLSRNSPPVVVGILTRGDILAAYRESLRELERTGPGLGRLIPRPRAESAGR